MLGARHLEQVLADSVGRDQTYPVLDDQTIDSVARRVVLSVAETRSTWTIWNVYAETERALRPARFESTQDREAATCAVLARATGPELSIRIAEPELIEEPPALRRASDGQSVFIAHGSERFTTSAVLCAEDALVAAGRSTDASHCDDVVVQAALAIHESRTRLVLDSGQRALVETFAGSPARLAIGIGPAGTGKTTAMQAFRDVWRSNGGRLDPVGHLGQGGRGPRRPAR